MYTNLTDLQKIAIDAYYNRTENFAQLRKSGDDIIRDEILERIGEPMPSNKSEFRRYFKSISNECFGLLEKTITAVHNDVAFEPFGDFVQTEILDEGEAPDYTIENTDLFDVSVKATGVGTSLRQKMENGKLETTPFVLTIKIYDEFFRFLTGRINWTSLVDRVAKSFSHKLATIVTGTLFNAYDDSNNPFHVACNKDAVDEKLQDVINKLSATVGDVQILGTKAALSNIVGLGGAFFDGNDKRMFGYVKMFGGVPCVELAQGFDKEAKLYDIPNDKLLVVPTNSKLIYSAFEGDVEIDENLDKLGRKDRQIEMEMSRMARVGVAVAVDFGMLKIQ